MDNQQESRFDRMARGLIILGISGLIDLILFGVFGYAGNFIKNILIGIFGYAVYGYALGFTLTGIFVVFGFKKKIEDKIIIDYALIVTTIVCMGHLITYKVGSNVSYAKYITDTFISHDSLGGAIISTIMFPLAKVSIVGIVILVLFLIGFIALAIVNQLNFEIGLKLRSSEDKPKKQKQNYFSKKDTENTKYIYNAPVVNNVYQKQIFDMDIYGNDQSKKKSRFGRKTQNEEFIPIEEVDMSTDEDKDALISSLDVDNGLIASEIELTQERARMFSEAAPITEINQESEIYKVPVEEQPETQQPELTDLDRSYFNSTRRNILNNNNKNDEKIEIVDETPSINIFTGDSYVGNNNTQNNINDSKDPFADILAKFEEEDKNSKNMGVVEVEQEEEEIEDNTLYGYPSDDIDNFIDAENDRKEKEEQNKLIKNYNLDALIDKKEEVKPIEKIEETPKQEEPKIIEPKIIEPKIIVSNKTVKKEEEPPKVVEKPKPVIKPYNAPVLTILNDYPSNIEENDMSMRSELLKETLASFKVNVDIVDITTGPTFSRIDFKLETGTPIGNVRKRIDDIKMGLSVTSLRLLAPIPGKNYCGVEVPNTKRSTIGLKNVLTSEDYINGTVNTNKGLYFVYGKDIDGSSKYYDLSSAPHMLIAGTSGSGKSVAINTLICSLLYRYSPQDLRFILFDPKIVEFKRYEGIPHLLIPNILTEPPKALSALLWAVNEMERRYQLMSVNGVTSIKSYNELSHVKSDISKKIPYIVIIIDEFADVMQSEVAKQFEAAVKRLTAKARAAGIHLILATQRPTTDVVSGTIKANLPTRMALTVGQAIDSITIIGQAGAEELLGRGDMLFQDPSSPILQRVQGCWISDTEVNNIVKYLKENNNAYFDDTAMDVINKNPVDEESDGEEENTKKVSKFCDERCIEAVQIVVDDNKASISYLQRKMGLGFGRAAKIYDWMKDSGIFVIEGKDTKVVATQETVERLKRIENGEEEE